MDDSKTDEKERPDAIPGADGDDVEGHYLMPDPELNRAMAQAREAEIERRLRLHESQAEAKHHQGSDTKKQGKG